MILKTEEWRMFIIHHELSLGGGIGSLAIAGKVNSLSLLILVSMFSSSICFSTWFLLKI